MTRGREVFPDYLGMRYKQKVYGVRRVSLDHKGLQVLKDIQGLLVLLVNKVYPVTLENLARGEGKVKVDSQGWMAFLDLLVLRVHLDHQETKETLDLLVCQVKLDFQANRERLENLVFLVKMAWMVFLEVTVPWGSGASVEQMVFLASLDPRATKGLLDQEDLQGREGKLVLLDS